MSLLRFEREDLLAKKAVWTAQEIDQQPEMIQETQRLLILNQKRTDDFLAPLLCDDDLRIIFTGAGTSAFVGECLAPMLSQTLGKRCEAISTTDLVSAPYAYLDENTPTLLVSFARSGNSPESVAAIDIADQCVKDINHLVITCNRDGLLLKRASGSESIHAILLPEKTHDRSFAMTSSFTSMLYAALSSFTGPEKMNDCALKIANASQGVLDNHSERVSVLAEAGFNRVVYLGSHSFKGIAQESALKLLELTDGETVAVHDSPMGFRHGPKTFVNEKTLVVIFLSNDPYTRKYDLDLLNEIKSDGVASVVAITGKPLPASLSDCECIILEGMDNSHDHELLVPFMLAPQIFAFYQSLFLGHSPDNPDTTGMVNRVVKGVKIHAIS